MQRTISGRQVKLCRYPIFFPSTPDTYWIDSHILSLHDRPGLIINSGVQISILQKTKYSPRYFTL